MVEAHHDSEHSETLAAYLLISETPPITPKPGGNTQLSATV
jgi:hypothetical protein